MRTMLAAMVAAWVFVSGCSSTTSSEDFSHEDAVGCPARTHCTAGRDALLPRSTVA
jgi:hypothetical protein